MKKTIRFVCLLLITMILFTGCIPGVSPVSKPDPSSEESQLEFLNETYDFWIGAVEGVDHPVFCVTDLDRNGRLELILSYTEGSGYFSYSSIFEVSEAFDAIEEVDTSAMEETSEPDLAFYDKYLCVEEDGKYYYIVEDVVRNGYAESVFYKQYICLEDGTISSELIGSIEARIEQQHGEDVLKTKYYDDEGRTVSRTAFADLDTNWFSDDAEWSAIRFGWTELADNGDNAEGLAASYELFGPATGYTGNDDLFEYPYTFYNMKETVLTGN